MKIISKFKDYYDRALSLGQDDRVPYIRLTEKIPQGIFEPKTTVLAPQLRWQGAPQLKKGQHPHIERLEFGWDYLYVCGKTYRFARIEIAGIGFRKVNGEDKYFAKPQYEYFYTYDQFCRFVESFGFLVKDIYSGRMFGQEPHSAKIEAFLSAQGTTENEAQLVEKRLVAIRDGGHEGYEKDGRYGNRYFWEHNFPLAEVQFYKLMDPYQIYQELDMYVCGVLGQQTKEVVKISDKDRIYQHGFDNYSFRKMPEEGKKKK